MRTRKREFALGPLLTSGSILDTGSIPPTRPNPCMRTLLQVDAGEVVAPKCTQSKSSTGFYGIMLAVQLCAEVNVYLFTGTPDHYYNKVSPARSRLAHLQTQH
jgi:hypothetical protein